MFRMNGLALLLLAIITVWIIAYFRLDRKIWAGSIGLLLLLFQYYGWIAKSAWIFWPFWLGSCAFVFIRPLRYRIFSRNIFHWFCKKLPPIGETEKEAIEAGEVAWERALFQGKPQWKTLCAFPAYALSEEENAFLNNQVQTLCDMSNDWEIVHERGDLPEAVWGYLKREKFFSMIIPKKYGGLEFSVAGHSAVITKLATCSVSLAVTAMVPNSLGPAELLLHYGTLEQKEYYLPRLASGEEMPCFALTGPEAGSDAGLIPDTGVIEKGQYKGKEVLGIRLNFDKRYITLAPVATLIGLAFKLFDPEHLLGEKTELGITLCLIPRAHPGIEIGARHFPLNMAFMNGPVRGKEVFIPVDWIIGGPSMAGKGWRMLMECLSAGRGISLPALSTATGMLSSVTTGAYAAIRRQFGMPIGRFEGIQEALARIAGFSYLLEATRLFTVHCIEQHHRPAIATAIAKYHMTELSRKVVNAAMDVHGGRGIMLGARNYLARGYQAIPISITVEGANILTRNLMIFGQGAMRCHPYIREELAAAALLKTNPNEALAQFDALLLKHIGYFLSNFSRCVWLAWTQGALSWVKVSPDLDKYIKKLNWLSAALAVSADVAFLFLGGDLKRKERLSARLGDILSYLYLASAAIKYYMQQEVKVPSSIEWTLQYCLHQAQEAFYGFFKHFPQPVVGKVLKWKLFPFGRVFTLPSDQLDKKLAQLLLTKSAFRKQFLQGCYLGDSHSSVGLVERTFEKLTQVENTLEKLLQAIKFSKVGKAQSFEQQIEVALEEAVITSEEAQALREYENLRKEVIKVDEFPADYGLGSIGNAK